MKRVYALVILALVFAVLAIPTFAQEGPGAGEGGTLIEPNIGADPATWNRIIYSDTTSANVLGYLLPGLLPFNPETLTWEQDYEFALVDTWEYNDDSTVLTLNLRQDLFWNDGTPITAADYLYAANAVRSGQTSSPRTSMFETLDDGTPAGGKIQEIVALDDYTVQVTFSEADCLAFGQVDDSGVVPAHIYEQLFGTDYALMDENPRDPRLVEVSFGPFRDLEFRPGEGVSLIDDQSYPFSSLGYVAPSEWIYLNIPNTNVAVERFLAGELTHLPSVPANRQAEIEANPDFQYATYAQNGYTYMAFQLGDPANPQNGVDDAGNPIDQGIHPIFGDVRVRQALTMAVDMDAIIEGVLTGNGSRVATHDSPYDTVVPTVEPVAYDPAGALALLAEAGWVDDDDNASTPLVCQGCLYAVEVDPAFEGSEFVFELKTNAGNVVRERAAESLVAQFAEIGVVADYSAIDFNVLISEFRAQTLDAWIIGWSIGIPNNPLNIFAATQDIVNSGFNAGSYNNPEFESRVNEANTYPGCEEGPRNELSAEALSILANDAPYIWLFATRIMDAAQANITNFAPLPLVPTWNIDAWSVE